MERLRNKNILVGITGGIAAYKTVSLVRLLIKTGANVKCVPTRNALQFVTRLTLETVSRAPVYADLFEPDRNYSPEHISLADWADLLVVAPATANILGKTASGIADDLLSSVIMAVPCPVLFAPAMNTRMYENPLVQKNIKALSKHGYHFIGPGTGELASGAKGAGRLVPEADIVARARELLGTGPAGADLAGKTVLVTAGRTEEPLDPVRVLTNRSSGKMGFAVALAARDRGARVILVHGRTDVPPPDGVTAKGAETVEKMKKATLKAYSRADLVVMTAAVSDYKVKKPAAHKVKKSGDLSLDLVPAPDILKELGQRKKGQVLVGFALETRDELAGAKKKIKAKNLDLVVVNNPHVAGAGFGSDTNVVTILNKKGKSEALPRMAKREVADAILDRALPLLKSKKK